MRPKRVIKQRRLTNLILAIHSHSTTNGVHRARIMQRFCRLSDHMPRRTHPTRITVGKRGADTFPEDGCSARAR